MNNNIVHIELRNIDLFKFNTNIILLLLPNAIYRRMANIKGNKTTNEINANRITFQVSLNIIKSSKINNIYSF